MEIFLTVVAAISIAAAWLGAGWFGSLMLRSLSYGWDREDEILARVFIIMGPGYLAFMLLMSIPFDRLVNMLSRNPEKPWKSWFGERKEH